MSLHDLLSLSPKLRFYRSLMSAICNPEHNHWMGMPQITNGGPKRARKRSLRERDGGSCTHAECDVKGTVRESVKSLKYHFPMH